MTPTLGVPSIDTVNGPAAACGCGGGSAAGVYAPGTTWSTPRTSGRLVPPVAVTEKSA
ncbi:hypothetical protein [Phytohabitans rumicis]|uniref:hypothetical protein n=1 Tax=Phytohabitans rumicis TaxID=1076125 RepID=UPI001FE8226F|nr:hypothetical protein [Phytohabitans rumicis]